MKRIIEIIMAFFPMIVLGQSRGYTEKPFWTNGYFKEMQKSYIEVVAASGYDIAEAKTRVLEEVVKRRAIATGAEANMSMDVNNNLTIQIGKDLIVKARVIDEYVYRASNGYTIYWLLQTAKNPTYQYESVSFSTDYGVGARAFVPGMAQIYKGSKVKGYSIIAAQALTIGSIILCENQRATYIKKMKEQPKYAQYYSNKVSKWETGRNISIGAAAGVYIYNIIDAFVSKGGKNIIVDTKNLSINPMVTVDSSGVSFAYNF